MKYRFLLVLALGAIAAPLIGQAPKSAASPSPAAATAEDAAYQQAAERARSGDFAGAIRVLEPLRSSASAHTLSLLGTLYVEAGRAKDALAVLGPLAAAPDAEPAVLYNAGRAALGAGDRARAQAYLQRAVAAAPDSPASRELGLLFSHEGRAVEAYALLRRWVLANPDDGEPRVTAALLALRLERPEETESLLRGFDSKDPGVTLLRGEAATAKGDSRTALGLLEPLAKAHPPGLEEELHRALAEAYLLAGNAAAAGRELGATTSRSPSVTVLRARAQRLGGNPTAAVKTLQPLIDHLPQGAQSLPDPRPAASAALEYGLAQGVTNGPAAAIPYLERATTLNPLSRDAWNELALAYDRQGRAADAATARAKLAELRAPAGN